MSELKTLDLPENKSKVKIFLDHNPCSSCFAYLAVLRRATGITFSVEPLQSVVPSKRGKKSGACDNCKPTKIPPSSNLSLPIQMSEEVEHSKQADYDELDEVGGTGSPFEPDKIGENVNTVETSPVVRVQRKKLQTFKRSKWDCSPPKVWTRFRNCAKPIPRAVGRRVLLQSSYKTPGQDQSGVQDLDTTPSPVHRPTHRSGASNKTESTPNSETLREAITTIEGRSGFFGTPAAEIELPPVDRSVGDSSNDPIPTTEASEPARPRGKLDLKKRFEYTGHRKFQHLQQRLRSRSRSRSHSRLGLLPKKKASETRNKTGKAKLRAKNKEAQIRNKSVFGKAFQFHQRKQKQQQQDQAALPI
ncbi:hypothetical protein B0T24DRAFT_193405 [Lasiosphaeria ovina]|uniref:Uncharacterized protein n=1 Tax=Lasiosphaeria ovina TaxID=92902 RepID=A0AAE0TUL7_9PEZI|nr:hypothetical protein B0T24DRAFT_193405 [Lasiosphaeria ovina]